MRRNVDVPEGYTSECVPWRNAHICTRKLVQEAQFDMVLRIKTLEIAQISIRRVGIHYGKLRYIIVESHRTIPCTFKQENYYHNSIRKCDKV